MVCQLYKAAIPIFLLHYAVNLINMQANSNLMMKFNWQTLLQLSLCKRILSQFFRPGEKSNHGDTADTAEKHTEELEIKKALINNGS
jgi:hypothetical protein